MEQPQSSFLDSIHTTLWHHSPEYARMFRFVVKSAKNPTAYPVDKLGCTPLHYLVSIGAADALNICLTEQHYDVNQLDAMQQTALVRALNTVSHITGIPTNVENVQSLVFTLLIHGADPNLCGPNDPTPLMLAVLREDPTLVRLLLAAGADPCVRLPSDGLLLKKGDTALSLAVRLHKLLDPNAANPTTLPQFSILTELLQSPRITPNIMFHAIQQTKIPFLKQYILNFRNLNAAFTS